MTMTRHDAACSSDSHSLARPPPLFDSLGNHGARRKPLSDVTSLPLLLFTGREPFSAGDRSVPARNGIDHNHRSDTRIRHGGRGGSVVQGTITQPQPSVTGHRQTSIRPISTLRGTRLSTFPRSVASTSLDSESGVM